MTLYALLSTALGVCLLGLVVYDGDAIRVQTDVMASRRQHVKNRLE